MIYTKIPVIDALENAGALQFSSYKIKSSIFEPTPTANFKLMAQYATPEALNLLVGSEFSIKYTFEVGTTDQPAEYKTFPDLVLKKMKLVGSGAGLEYEVECRNVLEFFQNSETRKCYKNKYSNEIMGDLFDSLPTFNEPTPDGETYERNFKKSEGSATLYRTLGDTDLEFIQDQVCQNFKIDGGKPLFFIGLDRKLNMASINSLLLDSTKSKVVIKLSPTNDALSTDFINEKVKAYVEEPPKKEDGSDGEICTLVSTDFTLELGNENCLSGLKPTAFFTRFDSEVSATSGYSFVPEAGDEKKYFPVAKNFENSMPTSDAKMFFNRPAKNILAEAFNNFKTFEDLIKIRIKINNVGELKTLLLAGDKVCVITPYPYSAFNGEYLVSSIAYGAEKKAPFLELEVIRPNLDVSWTEKLAESKEDEKFSYPYAPELNKTILFSI